MLGSGLIMNVDKSLEKQYTLLLVGLSLEEKSWLYKTAKSEGKNQSDFVLNLIRKAMEGVQ